jgi:hypothetical protein
MNRTGERFLNSIITTTDNGANVGAQKWLLRSAGWAFPIRRVRARSGAIFDRPLPRESTPQIMVQLGSTNCFQGSLKRFCSATRAACFQLVTVEDFAVTAEAAGSSPVVPAIHSEAFSE